MLENKTIFISALDWGLGHATRSVPIIRNLERKNKIILGITPLTKNIYDEEFPLLEKINLPAYSITYSKILPLWLKLGLMYPKISKIIADENRLLDEIHEKYHLDVVISDNRFGLHHKKIHSIFITHQLFLKAPIFQSLSQKLNQQYITKFNEVWVPDYKDINKSLSGELSHNPIHFHSNVKYINPQSRLAEVENEKELIKYDYLILLSGPEPARTKLESELLKKISHTNKKIAFVRGSKLKVQNINLVGVDLFDFPSKELLKKLILSSSVVICRSGYSTLMDMHLLNKKELILIPTPGQSEQEYLANYWKKKFNVITLKEKKLNSFEL